MNNSLRRKWNNVKIGALINYITTLYHEDKHKVVTIKRQDGVIEVLFIPTEKESKWKEI